MSMVLDRVDPYVLLDETLPVIHAALIRCYAFTEAEAEAFKDTLAIWFHRVVRRSGVLPGSDSEIREQILFVACKYARAFQLAKVREGVSFDPILQTAFSRPPEEIAMALLDRLQPSGAV